MLIHLQSASDTQYSTCLAKITTKLCKKSDGKMTFKHFHPKSFHLIKLGYISFRSTDFEVVSFYHHFAFKVNEECVQPLVGRSLSRRFNGMKQNFEKQQALTKKC